MKSSKEFSSGKMKLWLISIICVLLAIASCFFAWILHSDYQNNYKQIQQQYYRLICGQIVENMESSIKYGKDIERFYGMDTVFTDMYQYISPTISAYILGSDGSLLYSADESKTISASVTGSTVIKNNLIDNTGDDSIASDTLSDGSDVILFPILKADGKITGAMILVIGADEYKAAFDTELRSTIKTTLIVVLSTIGLIVFIIMFYPVLEESSRKSLFRIVMGLTIISMAIQGTTGYLNLQKQYKASMVECGDNISAYIGNLVGRVHDKGIAYEDMDGLSEFLAERVNETSLIWSMKIINVIGDSDELLNKEGQNTFTINLETDDGNTKQLQFELSQNYMNDELLKLLLTFLSTAIVMMVAIAEVNRLPGILLNRRVPKATGKSPVLPAALRLMTFIVYMGNYTCLPYTAVLIRNRELSFAGLSVQMTATLPIAVECLGVILGIFVLNRISHKFSSKALLIISSLSLIIIDLLCVLPGSAAYLIGLRAICGFGSSSLKVALNRFTAYGGDNADINGNVAGINAGILGGIMCGGSLGAIICNVTSVYVTFFIAAVIVALFLPIALIITGHEALAEKGEIRQGRGGFLSLLRDKNVLLYLICVQIPLNFGLMFIVAFFPSFMEAADKSILTSYGYIINGLAGIYIGPFLLSALSKKLGNRRSMAFVMALGAVSIFILGFDKILIITAMLSAALMGIFDEYGNPIASDYFLQIPAVKKMGASEALGYMSIIALLAQSASPMLYSALISGLNTKGGMTTLIPIVSACVLDALLILIFLKDSTKEAVKQKIS